MNSSSISKAYEEYYYAHNCGTPMRRNEEWLNFFNSVAERIVRDIGPAAVLDAGCAMGFLVETLRSRGVNAVGLDISEYAIKQVHPDVSRYCWVGSVTDPLPQRYDLIVCIEVMEHLSPQEADRAIENLCKHADDILFSSTPFDYKEATHFNVRPPDYWAQRFAQHEFYRDVDFDASFLTPWAVRFRKTSDPTWRIVYGYERELWQLAKEVQARRELTIEQMGLLSEAQQQIRTLTETSAEREQTIQSLTAEITRHQENIESLTSLLNKEQERSAEITTHQESIESLTALLNEEKERSQQLQQRDAERLQAISNLAQLSEQYSKLEALIAPLVSRQSSLDESLARLLESRAAIDTLVSQIADKERTVRNLTAEITNREQAIQTLKLREKGTNFTLNNLTQRNAEQEKAIKWQASVLADKDALIAYYEAKIADVNSSLVWWLYNRIKYPYLLFFFKLYERIKTRYLMRLYRRLGLVATPRPTASTQIASTQIIEPEANVSLPPPPPPAAFTVSEVAPPHAVAPHSARADIIICVHNALEDVKRCLDSVVYYTRMPYSLILVDDGSDDETRTYLASFARSQGAVLIRNEQAKGYTLAANQGLKSSRGEYVVLLNSDTVVTPLWLDRMIACGEADPHVGLIGPLSNVASWQSIPEISRYGDWPENKLPEGFAVPEMGKLLETYSARIYPRIPFLNGFCLMIKRGVIEQVGYFDEAVFGKGYGEENDYCLRARKAGWHLAVADDTYVYHAQSRSYSHERRKELSRQADLALASKHDPQMIMDGVLKCQTDIVMAGIRARSQAMFERKQLIESGMKLWEGKRVIFILTLGSACGGGNVVLDEAEAMRKMGVDARVLNLTRNREPFERGYPDNKVPVIYVEDESRVGELMLDCDAMIATANDTVYWLNPPPSESRPAVKGYYVQDFEPGFYNPDAPGFKIAWDSYTAHPDLVRFTKTEWNRDTVRDKTGAECEIVGPSVNLDLFRPRRRRDPDWPVRPLRVAAMIRPSTPRRSPLLTMEVLGEFSRTHGSNVEIILFGSESSDPEFLALPQDFEWHNAGMLTRPQLAFLMNEVDIFVDFSEFQAMGLTALEAMACGVGVIVPQKGGASSFAVHNHNALVVDTSSPVACLEALNRLALDEKLRAELRQQALSDVCRYYPERAAYNILDKLFTSAH